MVSECLSASRRKSAILYRNLSRTRPSFSFVRRIWLIALMVFVIPSSEKRDPARMGTMIKSEAIIAIYTKAPIEGGQSMRVMSNSLVAYSLSRSRRATMYDSFL